MTKLFKSNGDRKLKVSNGRPLESDWAPVISLRRDSLPTLDVLKQQLLTVHLQKADESLRPWLERAADDAVSLAWTLPFPALFLPELLAEKAEQATRRAHFQQSVLSRGPAWISLAA